MDKRDFLKASGALVASSMLGRLGSTEEQAAAPRENWAGNLTYRADHLYTPSSIDEVRDVVTRCEKLRALGSRHSFNRIADSTANQVSLEKLTQIEIDEKARLVTAGAGIRYGQLAPVIDKRGYALPNLASLPHISVAGAISTATHGSGLRNGNLATVVFGLEIVTADGNVIHLSRKKDLELFPGAVVGLGSVGVVTRVTLELMPTFQVAQSVYRGMSFEVLRDYFDEVFGAGYSVSLFTDWQNHRATQVWIKKMLAVGDKNEWPKEFFGAALATEDVHPIEGHPAESCTEQRGIPGPWYERLPHFKMNFTPSSGRELQTEYFVPQDRAYEAIRAVETLRDQITPLLFVTELRTIAADDLWMSMAYGRPSMAIHFTWKPDWAAVSKLLPQIEARLAPFGPRPHWGKLFTMPPAQVQKQYPRLAEFKALLATRDPKGKFRNEFVDANLYSN
ncbi:MAG TPA: FAD-binding protein [Terracidiphilus sp.]|nr:FAD-binding protein [Terracidiphilus sp.]